MIGGPPNSGKSTFAESLAQALQDQRIDAEAVDLDPWSPTLARVQGRITEEQREALKRNKIAKEDAEATASDFDDSSHKHQVVVGDAPGGISSESEVIYRKATHAIIVCRDDLKDAVDDWRRFLGRLGVKIIAVIISTEHGEEKIHSNDLIEATLLDQHRQPEVSATVRGVATLLKARLGI